MFGHGGSVVNTDVSQQKESTSQVGPFCNNSACSACAG